MLEPALIQGKGQYLNGTWQTGEGTPLYSTNPATGQIFWGGSSATTEEVNAASHSARVSLGSWAKISFDDRAKVMQRFATCVESHKDQLATLISIETGKPLWESYTEVTSVIAKINISIQACKERTWPKENITPDANSWIRYKPHGVIVVLGVFNFPAHLSNGHIIPALLAGNTVLYKPSEHTPAVAELIMQCWHESEAPPGVIQCLQGGVEVGKSLLSCDIQGVYFTGSYQTGSRIHQQFSKHPEVILALEMGGNNPLVVDEVRDLDAAVYQTLLSTLITSGQRCTCARRVILPDNAFGDAFLNRFLQTIDSLVIGPYDQDITPFMGPVISHTQAIHLLNTQEQLINLGGNSLREMTILKPHTGLISPGVMDMTGVQQAPDEEYFGPFIQLYRYHHFDEAIALANQTRYGLSAGLLSDSLKKYQKFYDAVRTGLVNWNKPTTGAASTLPFGGVGLSGNHRPSAYFAADYCAFPVASMEQPQLTKPAQSLPGIHMEVVS